MFMSNDLKYFRRQFITFWPEHTYCSSHMIPQFHFNNPFLEPISISQPRLIVKFLSQISSRLWSQEKSLGKNLNPTSKLNNNNKHLLSTRIHVLKSSMMFYLFGVEEKLFRLGKVEEGWTKRNEEDEESRMKYLIRIFILEHVCDETPRTVILVVNLRPSTDP